MSLPYKQPSGRFQIACIWSLSSRCLSRSVISLLFLFIYSRSQVSSSRLLPVSCSRSLPIAPRKWAVSNGWVGGRAGGPERARAPCCLRCFAFGPARSANQSDFSSHSSCLLSPSRRRRCCCCRYCAGSLRLYVTQRESSGAPLVGLARCAVCCGDRRRIRERDIFLRVFPFGSPSIASKKEPRRTQIFLRGLHFPVLCLEYYTFEAWFTAFFEHVQCQA